jgi:hypothetical protein
MGGGLRDRGREGDEKGWSRERTERLESDGSAGRMMEYNPTAGWILLKMVNLDSLDRLREWVTLLVLNHALI